MNNVVSLIDATVVYPDGESTITALDHASLDLRAGQVLGVVGESGSGKSTMLSVAGALQVPTSGEVIICGEHAEKASVAERTEIRREHIGFVFQSPNLLGALTAREQLLITEHLRGVRGKALRAQRDRAEELLQRVGLEGMGDRRPEQLSGGQRQRVNIARALMSKPQLLLADEPTSALDAKLSQEIVQLIRELTDEFQFATMMITHNRSQLDIADRIVEMRDGKMQEIPASEVGV